MKHNKSKKRKRVQTIKGQVNDKLGILKTRVNPRQLSGLGLFIGESDNVI